MWASTHVLARSYILLNRCPTGDRMSLQGRAHDRNVQESEIQNVEHGNSLMNNVLMHANIMK
jgi:hypothetical protein